MELNVNPTTLTNQAGTTFFQITSKTQINIYGNLGIGTDIPLSHFHLENISFDEKVIRLPTASNIYNYRAMENIYSMVPTGSVIIYPIDNPTYITNLQRQGWYECNGQTLLGSNFPLLSKVIAGQFGNTNPVTTYITLPDLRDKIGIGSTIVGYTSPADDPLYVSPSNLYSNTIIRSIQPSHTFQLTYDHLPNHTHFVSTSEDAIPVAGDGSHTHTYTRASSKDAYQKYKTSLGGVNIMNTGLQTLTTDPTPASGTSDNHTHAGTFKTDANGKSCILNTNGTIQTIGGPLVADPISIRQPGLTMIYLLKCL